MFIVYKVLLYDFFKIVGINLFSEERKCVQLLNMNKRKSVVVQPAVQTGQSKQQSLRIMCRISLPVLEFFFVKACKQGILIKTFPYDPFEFCLYYLYKLILIGGICIFRNY